MIFVRGFFRQTILANAPWPLIRIAKSYSRCHAFPPDLDGVLHGTIVILRFFCVASSARRFWPMFLGLCSELQNRIVGATLFWSKTVENGTSKLTVPLNAFELFRPSLVVSSTFWTLLVARPATHSVLGPYSWDHLAAS